MLIDTHDVVHEAPTVCAHCGRTFHVVNDHVECWRSSNGKFFCSEFCADDAEEKAFCARRHAK